MHYAASARADHKENRRQHRFSELLRVYEMTDRAIVDLIRQMTRWGWFGRLAWIWGLGRVVADLRHAVHLLDLHQVPDEVVQASKDVREEGQRLIDRANEHSRPAPRSTAPTDEDILHLEEMHSAFLLAAADHLESVWTSPRLRGGRYPVEEQGDP